MNTPSKVLKEMNNRSSAPGGANRLAGESSPYLRQHAHNPVDWYPWGNDALDRAREEDKPVFLSIGYSACHWCHVMERESFEDPETAELLADNFIAIKVDRQERPDLDDIYMTAVQMMTGGGGWPLSVFLTPDLKPFFGGTYFPPDDRHGLPGFKTVLRSVAQAWRERPGDVAEAAQRMVGALRESATPRLSRSDMPDASLSSNATAELKRQFDGKWGGFGGAPKFPPSAAIALLLRQHFHTGENDLLEMATVTLDRMACGGLYDQLGGGFHRYSVDARWLVPHFEKMLYDNALLARTYLESWQATRKELYRRVAVGILDYVLRDMTDSRGGFHSAEDADSEGEEGKFYVWKPDEIKAILGEEDGTFFCRCHGVSDQGNFEGYNILNVPLDVPDLLPENWTTAGQLEARLSRMRSRLLAARCNRVRPSKDDNILAAWNGMMISSLARGYQVLGDQRYLDAARKAADFVLTEMLRDGVLRRTVGGPPGCLDDYAEMAGGLIDLYEACFDRQWLQAADSLTQKMITDFWDREDGGFFYTSPDHKDLLVRMKPFYDGAVPSGNSSATMVLLRLSRVLDNREYLSMAETVLRTMAEGMRVQSMAYLNLLCVLDFCLCPATEIAIVGKFDSDDTRRMLQTTHSRFLPNKTVVLADPSATGSEKLDVPVPLLNEKKTIAGKATVYVCRHSTCLQPVDDPADLEMILHGDRQVS